MIATRLTNEQVIEGIGEAQPMQRTALIVDVRE